MYYILLYTTLFVGILPVLIGVYRKNIFTFSEPIIPFVWLTFIATFLVHDKKYNLLIISKINLILFV